MANLALIKVLENIAPSIASSVKKYSVGKEYDKLANDIRSFKEIKDKELTEVTNIYNDLLEKKAPEEQISLAKIKKDQLEMETKQYAVNPVAQMFLAGNYPRSDEEFQRSLSLFNLVRGQGTTSGKDVRWQRKTEKRGTKWEGGKKYEISVAGDYNPVTKEWDNVQEIVSDVTPASLNVYERNKDDEYFKQAVDTAFKEIRVRLNLAGIDQEDYQTISEIMKSPDAQARRNLIIDMLQKKGATQQKAIDEADGLIESLPASIDKWYKIYRDKKATPDVIDPFKKKDK